MKCSTNCSIILTIFQLHVQKAVNILQNLTRGGTGRILRAALKKNYVSGFELIAEYKIYFMEKMANFAINIYSMYTNGSGSAKKNDGSGSSAR